MSEKSTMQLLLEARFEQLAAEREEHNAVPKELHKEVFRTLDMLDMFGEITDLFTGKLGETTAEFLDVIENPAGGDEPEEIAPFDPADF